MLQFTKLTALMAIAIIGGGLSGTLTAIFLLRSAASDTTIYFIEQDRYRMSRGIAYSSQLPFQPLNVPISAMSLFPDKPGDFFDWLKLQQHLYKKHLKLAVSKEDFIPRFIFGDYLKARLEEAVLYASKRIRFVRIYDEAVAVKQKGDSFQISFNDYQSITAARVVLALGNFPPGHLPIVNKTFYNSKLYVSSPWVTKGLANLDADAALLLIGSSLTMVDLVGSLKEQGHQGKIYVVSRHGLLPQCLDVNTPTYHKLSFPTPLSVSELFRLIRVEIRTAQDQGYTWRSVLDAMRDAIPALWQAFSLSEKRYFLQHLRPYWETHRHRMPASSACLIEALQKQGQLEVIAANIIDMVDEEKTACITIKTRKHHAIHKLQVSRVINCTGPQCDYTKIKAPVIEQLLADGLISPDSLRLGLQTTPDGTLVGVNKIPVDGLYTLGPPRKAMLYESSALREIRQQAIELAHKILDENNAYKKEKTQS